MDHLGSAIMLIALGAPFAHILVSSDEAGIALWLPDTLSQIPAGFGPDADRRLKRASKGLLEIAESAQLRRHTHTLSPTLLIDMKSAFGISGEAKFSGKCFEILDGISHWDRLLESAWSEFQRAELSSRNYTEFREILTPRGTKTYHMLKTQIQLSQGLARALVAQRMARWNSHSYSLQAMESAVNGLQMAARGAEESGRTYHGMPVLSAGFLRALRANLLQELGMAKRRKSLDPILHLSLRSMVQDALSARPDPTAQKGLGWLLPPPAS